ncbi:tRNA (guanine-1-)-methyltransferase [Desulfamplus magnetovallimortis]|uniref:tRNA (guanine-N(1)-)-methyltransferase n=1 Tax=Desulfamplus magnetovallimortis TaxID=1246637 RepID=A0A1W1H679_9BACT|nr:tRNA (guanosine(37)-N1)-methyltransferase TrmD [Desulfamplus magnetovallimortis]SLM27944.1 tRNA (guanine-1-)-methyltransferase [Desulfamplus magnetovallimortis]
MKFTVLTLFPEMVDAFFSHGMIARAIENELVKASTVNIRDFAFNRHNSVDDRPYGGGCGMVMRPEPLFAAIHEAKRFSSDSRVILMSPQGAPFDQARAVDMASSSQDFVFVCGRYEGIDERVFLSCVDEELSIGDYVMTGGELAAMVIMDAVIRLVPGVLGGDASAELDSFRNNRLEHAHYTRPSVYNGMSVPDVLLSGNHEKIEKWRQSSSLKRTLLKRPDLFDKRPFSSEEKDILKKWYHEMEQIDMEFLNG